MVRPILVAALASAGLACATAALAADPPAGLDPDLTGPAKHEAPLTEKTDFAAELTMARVLERERAHVLECYGASAAPATWDSVLVEARAFAASQQRLDQLGDDPAVQRSQVKLDEARSNVALATERLKHAEGELEKVANAANERALDEADAALEAAQQKEDAAVEANAEAREQASDARYAEVSTLRDRFARTLAKAENIGRSPANFRRAVEDPARRAACAAYSTAVAQAFNLMQTELAVAHEDAEEDAARTKARVEDTIGKTTSVASALTGTSSAVEQPGAPERVVYTVMSALGADSQSTGTQLLMTLNLTSALQKTGAKPVQSALLRNLFLRVGLPLEKTSAAAPAPAAAADSTGADVSRLSFVLGGSLLDESDPRLPSHDDCFDFARRYAPFALDEGESEKRVKERQLYYGQCAQIAANRARLAWRAGLGVTTTREGDRQETKPELMALALVYGPSDWILFNLIGQRIIEPHVVNTVGGGVSLYVDAGGETPGSQWGRLSLDTLVLGQFRPSDTSAGIDGSSGWEARVSVGAAGKITSGGVGQVAVGPRILGSGDVGLFATVALSYDGDALIESLLRGE